MPASEIKELRKAGKLKEAFTLAKAELDAEPDNIWPKRNISWVYYEYLKQNSSPEHFNSFISCLREINNLQLPAEEKMLFEQVCWQIGKMAFALSKTHPVDVQKSLHLFEATQTFHLPKPSEGYSFLFKGFHKLLKENDKYLDYADWWDFQNFMPGDFQKEKLPNGRDIMSVAEQAYIAYAKKLLTGELLHADGHSIYARVLNTEKINDFIPQLDEIINSYPSFQFPLYFKTKLLLALGNQKDALTSILPFAKKKQNEFWVWEILGEAFSGEADKTFACYCKALSCKSPEEMLVGLRQKMAELLISKKLYDEAKTEIELLVEARSAHGFKIPDEVINWQGQDWYKIANARKTNNEFYKQHTDIAESLLYSDVPEETVIVEFVNADKKILNFIAKPESIVENTLANMTSSATPDERSTDALSEENIKIHMPNMWKRQQTALEEEKRKEEPKFGFFKYDRFLKDVKIGDTLKVRFKGEAKEGMNQLYTAINVNDEAFRKQYLREVEGVVKISKGQSFGFLNDVFVHPSIVSKLKLMDGIELKGRALKTFNQDKKQWGWKFIL